MTYQPYPTGGGSNVVQQQQGPRPQSVRTAVILMYVGAGLSVISLIASIALSSRIKNAVGKALRDAKTSKPLTASEIHSAENIYLVFAIVVLVVAIGLWLWMAWANGRGRGWARVVATVFFGLDTLFLLYSVSRTRGSTTLIFTGIEWLVGLAAIVFLWNRETTQYIAQSR
jgi:uncharacterized membrane protein (DUF2068 family)